MVNILSALGLAQLKRMPQFLKKKQEIHKLYKKELNNLNDIKLFTAPNGFDSNYWINLISFSDKILNKYALHDLINYFFSKGIQTRPLWTLMDSLKIYNHCYSYKTETSQDIHRRSLLIPSSTNLSKRDALKVSKAIMELV